MRIIANDGLVDVSYEGSSLFAVKDDLFEYLDEEDSPYTIMDATGIVLKSVPSKSAAIYILRDIRRRYFDSVGHPKKNEKMCVVNLDDYDNVIISGKYKEVMKYEK